MGAVCAPLLLSDVRRKTPSERVSDVEVIKTIRALVEFTLLSGLQVHSQILLKYLVKAFERYYRCKVGFAPRRATAARKARWEKDYSTQATEAGEEALAKFEASLQSKIYKVPAAGRQIFRVHLKKELELSRIWSAPDRTLVERVLDQSVFAATKTKSRRFEELYQDAQDRLDSQLRSGASHEPKSQFARELVQECLAIKTAVYGPSRVTAATIADNENQISMHEE